MRRSAGIPAAMAASAVVALDPLQIGWGRSDIHPHGSTVWPAILLCWVTLTATQNGRLRTLAAMAVLMGLSVHQYPSGQMAVIVPLLFFIWSVLFVRRRDGVVSAQGLLAISAGIAFGVVGLALPHFIVFGKWQLTPIFTIFGVRTSWYQAGSADSIGAIATVAARVWTNLVDLAASLWVQVPRMDIQDFIPDYPNSVLIPIRSVLWVGAALATVTGLAAVLEPRRRSSSLLLVWAFASALPLIFSDGSPPKRASNLYPALYALAAIGFSVVLTQCTEVWGRGGRRLALTFAISGFGLFAFASVHQWFSGTHYHYGEPKEVTISRRIAGRIGPGSIIIVDLLHPHWVGKLGFLVMDHLRGRDDVAWFVNPSGDSEFNPLASAPRLVNLLKDSLWYRWSDLWYGLPGVTGRRRWSKVLLLSQTHGDYPMENHRIEERLRRAREECPEGHYELLIDEGELFRFHLFECPLHP